MIYKLQTLPNSQEYAIFIDTKESYNLEIQLEKQIQFWFFEKNKQISLSYKGHLKRRRIC